MLLQAGRVVRSMAGHDKNQFYVVVQARDGRVTIADGRRRKLGKPKAKNVLHVSVTNQCLDMQAVTTDKKLRAALLPFTARAAEEEGN